MVSSLKNDYFYQLFSDKTSFSFEELDEFVDINEGNPGFIMIAFRIDSYCNLISNIKNIYIAKHAIFNAIDGIIRKSYKCIIFEFKEDILGIIHVNAGENISTDILAKLKSQIKKSLGYSISIGISNFHFKIDELQNAYDEAMYALDAKFFSGYNSILFFHDINKNQKNIIPYPCDMEKSIICSINKGDKKELEKSFNAFIKYLKDSDLTKECIIKMHKTLLFSLHYRLSEEKIDADIIIEYIDKLDDYGRFLTINEFKDKILNLLLIILDNLSSVRKDNKNIQKAIQYIKENYDKALDLHTVADNIYLTPCYVSMLFKKKLGINFVSYLQDIRLKKACDLLTNTKLKCYEIAYMVGFKDEKYFMQVFKKSFGVTPTQYRNS